MSARLIIRRRATSAYEVLHRGEVVGTATLTGRPGVDTYPWNWSVSVPGHRLRTGVDDTKRACKDTIATILAEYGIEACEPAARPGPGRSDRGQRRLASNLIGLARAIARRRSRLHHWLPVPGPINLAALDSALDEADAEITRLCAALDAASEATAGAPAPAPTPAPSGATK